MYTRRNKGVPSGGFFRTGWASFAKENGRSTVKKTHEWMRFIRFGLF
jgi:hypothetical protein